MKQFGIRKVLVPFEWKVKFCLHENYLNTGVGKLNFFKFFLYAFAGSDIINSGDYTNAFIAGGFYLVACYLIGMIWYRTDMVRAGAEVGNRYNLLTEELRKKFKLKKSKT